MKFQLGVARPLSLRHIVEHRAAIVDVESIGLPRVVGQKDVLVTIVVHIGDIDTHGSLSLAFRIDRTTGQQGVVPEGAVPIVHEQQIGHAVVGDVEIGPAIEVEVGRSDTQASPRLDSDAGLDRDILEGSIAAIAKQTIVSRRIGIRIAVVGGAHRVQAVAPLLDAEVDVVRDVEIQPSIAIEVHKAGADAPTLVIATRNLGDIGEGAVPIVAKQLIRAEVRHVEVGPAIVVVVPGRHTKAVLGPSQARLLRHVGEVQRPMPLGIDLQVIAVEPVGQGQWMLRGNLGVIDALARRQHRALHRVEIEIPIGVEVDQSAPRTHDLEEVDLARGAVEQVKIEPGRKARIPRR